MCKFFSCISTGSGRLYYFDSKLREKLKETDLEMDSHTSIAYYFKIDEDQCNKYEYSLWDNAFTIDQINTKDDSGIVQRQLDKFDWSSIVPNLAIKKFIYPFRDFDRKRVTKGDIERLKEWALIWDLVPDSVHSSVDYFLSCDAWRDVRGSVLYSSLPLVKSIGKNSVRNSSIISFLAYYSSFFIVKVWKGIKHRRGENPFQCCINLWERGLIPVFDGKCWHLLGGHTPKILWSGRVSGNKRRRK